MNEELKKKVETAVTRLQMYEPPEGYRLAFSGGKDSIVIKRLADIARVKYEAHYNVTSVDPPELVHFIKEKHPDVVFDIPKYKDGRQITMWSLIRTNGLPTRIQRFCCEKLKEDFSIGHMTITGVRWAESPNRAVNQGRVTIMKANKLLPKDDPNFAKTPRGGVVLVNDNDESRKIIEQCYQKGRVSVNPIVEWSDKDVWDFIRGQSIPYCSLYECGYSRLGCIGCPMAKRKGRLKEFARYPKYALLYRRAIGRWIDHCIEKRGEEWRTNNTLGLGTVDEWWHWWLQDRPIGQEVLPGFDDFEEDNDAD